MTGPELDALIARAERDVELDQVSYPTDVSMLVSELKIYRATSQKGTHQMTQEPDTSKANAPAFPISECYPYASGLTKREFFVAAALTGLCSEYSRTTGSYAECIGGTASVAVSLADATIKELEK